MTSLHMPYEMMVESLKRQGKVYSKYRSRLSEKEVGPWRIEKFEVEIGIQNFRMIRDLRGCSPGTFTRLVHKDRGVIMSDTDAEIKDFRRFVVRAEGNVLVAGLGMGLVVQNLLDKDVTVTVVEIDKDVIELTGSQLNDDRLKIVNADIFEWKTKEEFDYGFFDIWDSICEDNLEEMTKLKRKFARRVKNKVFWCESECKRSRF